MTLEEYQAKQAAEKKENAFQTRKAGENEDDSQWKNFAPLKKDEEGTYMGGLDEYEKVIVRTGRQKKRVEVDVKFANNPRRGGGGDRRGGRDDRGGDRGDRRDRRDNDRGDRRDNDRRDNKPKQKGGNQKAPNLESFSETEFPSLS